jgi:hypothetical protein
LRFLAIFWQKLEPNSHSSESWAKKGLIMAFFGPVFENSHIFFHNFEKTRAFLKRDRNVHPLF